jgi:AcrR family transcriptional regulator
VRTKTPLQAEKILKAAARLFATKRFHEARMEDIAAAAEVGKGTLYRYFRDKEELYDALLKQAAEHLSHALHEASAGVVDPRARLEAIVGALLTYFHCHPHLFDLIQHVEMMHRSDRAFAWQPMREETFALVEDTLRDGQRLGLFPAHDTELTARLLLGGLRAVLRFDNRPPTADLPARIMDIILHGIGSQRRSVNGATSA